MESKAVLHIHSGDSAAFSARRTLPGTHRVYADLLMDGPVPPAVDAEWGRARGSVLSPSVGYTPEQVASRIDRQVREIAGDAARADEIILWFDHCLYDQLILHFVIARLLPADADRVFLVPCPEACLGFGELPDEAFPVLRAGAARLSAGALRDSRERIWSALMSERVTAVEALAGAEVPEFPDTASAARRLLEQLPDPATGLDRLETEILQVLAEERVSGFVPLFLALQKRERYPFFGDDYVRNALRLMSGGTRPLVKVEGDTVEALPAAECVLRGEFRWHRSRQVANLRFPGEGR